MNALALCPADLVSRADLAEVTKLYEEGLYLQAYRRAEQVAPLRAWRGTEARILAGRMAGNLGATKLANWHFVRAWRDEPGHPEALWYYARYLADFRGTLRAWEFLKANPLRDDATEDNRSHWLALNGCVLGRLRDFDAAEKWLARAEELGERPWVYLERAFLLALEDRHDDAEQAARRALELRPWYRPAVQWVAHFLVQKERDQEALALLTEATTRLESSALFMQLAGLQLEMQRYAEAHDSIEAAARLAPLREKELEQWLAARRSDVAYFLGDLATAREQARRVKGNFYEKLVERLENPPAERRRVVLSVGFVQQHFQTCAPATLTAICRYWKMPGDHLETAAAISYAGTPHHSERQWAREHGWETKEFTVTWDSAVTLLDRGIPFTLTTADVSTSHLQAVIGYDATRGTLIIRDPNDRHQAEFDAAGLFERYRSTGPRGMALVPAEKAQLLRELSLPDEALHDLLHRVEHSLHHHRRADAEAACRELEQAAPEHPLTIHARRSLGLYDADVTQVLAATEKLLTLYPTDLRLNLTKASCLRDLARRDERLVLLKKLSEQTPTDPACWVQYAQELASDAREHQEVVRLLRRALRAYPMGSISYHLLARIRWEQRDFDSALELYRFALCLEDKDEQLARAYFQAARSQGRTDEALAFLRQRFQRFGKQSSHPARTLYTALLQLERTTDAFAVLDDALQLRPADGDLLLYAAQARRYQADFKLARELLDQARGISQPGVWERSAADLAWAEGDLVRAREHWSKVLESEPLAEDAHRGYARLLADTEGRSAALEHLRRAVECCPHHCGLGRLLLEWLRDDGPAAVAAAARVFVEQHPTDAWGRRELVVALIDQGRLDEAARELELAASLEPPSAVWWGIQGRLCAAAGRTAEAQEAYRNALRLSIDFDMAMHELVQLCGSLAERRAALEFIGNELVRQVTLGEGLLAYRDAAALALEAQETLELLQKGLAARPDLWQAWSAVIRQLVVMNELDDALVLARQACERFPHLPNLYLDLAGVYRAGQDTEAEIEALTRAAQLAPGWNEALRQLADAFEKQGKLDEARATLQRAIAWAPLLAINHLALAEFLWRHEQQEEALATVRHALHLEPGLEAAWAKLGEWAARRGQAHLPLEYARALAQQRPGEARSWLRLGQALQANLRRAAGHDPAQIEECLQAYDQAIALNPRLADAYDLKALFLAEQGRLDDAMAACQSPVWNGAPPLTLQGRLAWLHARKGDLARAKEAMRQVLAKDPHYFWGWNQLADWLQYEGNFEEYRAAAEHLVRLAPRNPIGLAYRGEARLRLGDRDGGGADLEAALALNPEYGLPAYLLIDRHLDEKNTAAARAVLDRFKKSVYDDLVRAREVRLLALEGKQAEAEAILRTLCRSNEPGNFALDAALAACDRADWGDRVDEILQEAAQEQAFHPHVAVHWAQRWRPEIDGPAEPRLEALERALERASDRIVVLDLKAELLCRCGRFDEALAACAHPELSKAIAIRGRAAWVHAVRNDVRTAIQAMCGVLEEDPHYHWGWARLADWYEAQGRHRQQLEAAKQLVRLAPGDFYGYVRTAAARRALGEREGAYKDLHKAREVAPGVAFPAFELAGMLQEDRRYHEARKVLKEVENSCEPVEYALRMIELYAREGTRADQAVFHLQNLAKATEFRGADLQLGVDMICQAGWSDRAQSVLEANLDLGMHVAQAWINLLLACGYHAGARIAEMPADHQGRVHCLAAYAVALAWGKQTAALRDWVMTYQRELRASTRHWGQVGHAFSLLQEDALVVEWKQDWARRTDAEPWMLLNLVLALRGLGRDAEAGDVSRHALTRLKSDYTCAFHQAWLFFDAACAGKLEEAEKYLDLRQRGRLDPYHRFIAALAEAMLLARSPGPDRFAAVRTLLADSARGSQPVQHDRALRGSYRKCLQVVAQHCPGLGVRLWRLYRTLVPRLPPRQKAV